MMKHESHRLRKILVLFLLLCFAFVLSAADSAWAKYCPKCGTYNNDSNAFCTKCGADLKTAASSTKPRVGVLFVASVYPYQDARFTIYHKGTVTPFIVWNSEGKYELGEVTLPVLPDIEFVPIMEREIPTATSVPYIAKRYNVEKLMVLNMNAKKVERAPLFSSQRYEVFMDVSSYSCPAGALIQEKRYKGSVSSWPDITVTQVKDVCTSLWQQMVPNIYLLLRS
ncbi:MAG: zinc ribbon domain-containing protein [Candidatus Eremiobacteraeota bacterium]|nr:zinc ribbon domain-containing protein [Candidatus Eremiobacteraeota bacterium]